MHSHGPTRVRVQREVAGKRTAAAAFALPRETRSAAPGGTPGENLFPVVHGIVNEQLEAVGTRKTSENATTTAAALQVANDSAQSAAAPGTTALAFNPANRLA